MSPESSSLTARPATRRMRKDGDVIPEDNRFESDPSDVLPDDPGLPEGWTAEAPEPDA